MNTMLWISQIILAFAFVGHGWLLLALPKMTEIPSFAYMRALSSGFRRFIGTVEILGALGMILPGLTRILPVLTPLAAVGFVLVMFGAVPFHIQRKEYSSLILDFILLALAIYVAYGRFALLPL
jgi:hypothetical protein